MVTKLSCHSIWQCLFWIVRLFVNTGGWEDAVVVHCLGQSRVSKKRRGDIYYKL